ncbi:MAG: SMP-30/gluconolactonase/LRE family protein [Bifidobacteriaceae bacterium]|jgi:gluconolactonase|nr:SMP-30/gluconolactonase/LRE family protein [Bifidobacteriaceae bacterium]
MTREIRLLASGLGFTEGPVVLANGEIIVTSITHGALYRVLPGGGSSRLADLGGGANGAALAADGTLYVAQNGGRWAANGPAWPPSSVGGIQRVYPDGSSDWLTKEPLAPNDLCFGPDGKLYVTDPTRSKAINDGRIWRIDPETGASELLASVRFFPNGIAFDAADDLYLAATDSGGIFRTRVTGGTLAEPVEVFRLTHGFPDGMAFDAAGNLVIGAVDDQGQGTVQTWTMDGALVEELVPGPGHRFTNVAFTGDGGLVICASDNDSVLLVEDWGAEGLPLHPFRGAGASA